MYVADTGQTEGRVCSRIWVTVCVAMGPVDKEQGPAFVRLCLRLKYYHL